MKASYMLSQNLAKRMILVHPPEPRNNLLLSSPSKGIYLGKTRWMGTPVFWNPEKLINPHIGIVGITGSGKSYLVKSFLTRAALITDANAIILDWVGEYGEWVRQAGGAVIDLSEKSLNLMDFAGTTKSTRIRQILSALDTLADLKNARDERDDIEEALESVFNSKRKPTINDLIAHMKKRKMVKALRIIKRFTSEGMDFFSGKSSIKVEKFLSSGLVCLDLHNLPSEEIRSLAGITILQFIKELMRKQSIREKDRRIKLFVVLDEAWKVASEESSDVITIVREGRKYNFALIVATQNPTDMHKTIFSNLGSTVILRLVLKEYRDYVRHSIGYSEFVDSEISKFGVGDAAINMIFTERQTRATTFLMNKIDGEEPLFAYILKVGDMNLEIEKEQLVKMLVELGLTDSQISVLESEFGKKDGTMGGDDLVHLLEKFGFSKSVIISFLRQAGVGEKDIIQTFSLIKMRRAKKGIVDVYLE